MINTLDIILIMCMSISTAIAFYMTVKRLLTNTKHLSYDSWIFGMCFALTLQLYESYRNMY
jgi:hypothetical protein